MSETSAPLESTLAGISGLSGIWGGNSGTGFRKADEDVAEEEEDDEEEEDEGLRISQLVSSFSIFQLSCAICELEEIKTNPKNSFSQKTKESSRKEAEFADGFRAEYERNTRNSENSS